jgi:S1-C subfamily serine protease
VASLFTGYEVDEELRPVARLLGYDLDERLASVVALEARIPEDAYSARTLQTERVGNAIVISPEGLMLTIGYLVMEAEEVVVTTNDGTRVEAHVLGIDNATGFGLLHPLEPLGLPPMPIGDSRKVRTDAPVISAGAGGRSHALSGRIVAREAFAGYWEYYLEAALFVEPAHPHWNGAALIGPSGDLIGVGSLKMEQMAQGEEVSPLNLFVPAELLAPILDDLSHGRPARPPRPWLGLISQEISSHVVVADVSAAGPASRAELRRGDVIHRIAGHRISSLAEFYKHLWALGPPGVVAELTIQREHDVFDVAIRTVDRLALQKKRRLN